MELVAAKVELRALVAQVNALRRLGYTECVIGGDLEASQSILGLDDFKVQESLSLVWLHFVHFLSLRLVGPSA